MQPTTKQVSPPGCHAEGCRVNTTVLVRQDLLVELTDAGLAPLLLLPVNLSGSGSLEAGGVYRYRVNTPADHDGSEGMQALYEVPYADGGWDLGRAVLLTSFRCTNLTLASRESGASPSFPRTSDGGYVIFDGNDGHRPASTPPPFGNHGFHLGVVGPGVDAGFRWQASPWGTWNVSEASAVVDGVNGTLYYITPSTMDGRFGGNDTVQYGGSNAHLQGSNIVYGFPGEVGPPWAWCTWRLTAPTPPSVRIAASDARSYYSPLTVALAHPPAPAVLPRR
mmetsp:Transcript_23107/g.69411  ORF Transcript_23107/g.69411 Transcript_23107/m.69411 type:complete len:279 (-) Transcript_23107:486-1322(-)